MPLSSFARRLAAVLAILAAPVICASQSVISLRADSARRTIAPSSKLAVPVILDMNAAGGTNLASIIAGVAFGTSRLTFDSVRTAGFGALTANTAGAPSGSLTLSVFDATGTTTTQTLATMYFTAAATTGGTTIAFTPTVAGSDVGANILALLRSRSLDVCVAPSGKWGDVNGDSVATPLGDGTVNIIDAQQIARYQVELSVANRPGLVARGDVTADGNVNIIDAQQIARFSVGLGAAARVNVVTFTPPSVASVTVTPSTAQAIVVGRTTQLIATARDAGNADVTPCATVDWASSNAAVASVSASGLVTAVAAGTATITGSSAGQSAQVDFVVSAAGPPASASIHAGNNQYVFDSFVLTRPAVLVKDVANNPVPGVTVTFAVSSGGGGVLDAVVTTDASGIATVGEFDAGISRSPTTLKATVSGDGIVGNPVTFTAYGSGLGYGFARCELSSSGSPYCWGDNTYGQVGDGTTTNRVVPTAVSGGLMFVALAEGTADHTCGVITSGAAYCWGANTYGQLGDGSTADRTAPVLVGGGLTFASLSVSETATCGITAAGSLYCWGWEGYSLFGDGRLGGISRTPRAVATPGVTFTKVAVGAQYACAIATGGTMYCWGYGLSGELGFMPELETLISIVPTPIQDGRTYAAVAAGFQHTCALTTSGAAFCWGSGWNGQLGKGTLGSCYSPCAVSGGQSFASITVSPFTTCALSADGRAYCWGSNSDGQIGDGTTAQRAVPTAVGGGIVFGSLRTMGGYHGGGRTACGRAVHGQPFCWGYNGVGQIGDGTLAFRSSPTPVKWIEGTQGVPISIVVNDGNNQSAAAGTVVESSPSVLVRDYAGTALSGATVTFSVASGNGSVTGASQVTNASGIATVGSWTLGTAHGANTLTATVAGVGQALFAAQADGGVFPSLRGITAGGFHTCGVTSANAAFCWGQNFNSLDRYGGQLGDGTTTNRSSPTAVTGGLQFLSIFAGDENTCGVTTSAAGYCWGHNAYLLGDGTLTNRATPTAIAGGLTFEMIAGGPGQTCGVATGGAAYCWGGNSYGQLGDGTLIARSAPVAVFGGLTFQSVSVQYVGACGLTVGGIAFCWGSNGAGELGDGSTTNRTTPTAVAGGLTFRGLVSGFSHVCGLTTGGTAYCWGFDHRGRLGNGSGAGYIQSTPTAVLGGLTFQALSAGGEHTCGLTTGGAAYCWGSNSGGQLGDGSRTDRWTPAAVAGGLTFQALSVGAEHTCGITTGGVAYCWGSNDSGQLGDGMTISRLTPVSVRAP